MLGLYPLEPDYCMFLSQVTYHMGLVILPFLQPVSCWHVLGVLLLQTLHWDILVVRGQCVQ